MVLQREKDNDGSQAAVYGWTGGGATLHPVEAAAPSVKVTVTSAAGASYAVAATIDTSTGFWKALLRPAVAGGSYSVTATCTTGCNGTVTLSSVTFGDVWYCAGQSKLDVEKGASWQGHSARAFWLLIAHAP